MPGRGIPLLQPADTGEGAARRSVPARAGRPSPFRAAGPPRARTSGRHSRPPHPRRWSQSAGTPARSSTVFRRSRSPRIRNVPPQQATWAAGASLSMSARPRPTTTSGVRDPAPPHDRHSYCDPAAQAGACLVGVVSARCARAWLFLPTPLLASADRAGRSGAMARDNDPDHNGSGRGRNIWGCGSCGTPRRYSRISATVGNADSRDAAPRRGGLRVSTPRSADRCPSTEAELAREPTRLPGCPCGDCKYSDPC